jgi:hypothetical protein
MASPLLTAAGVIDLEGTAAKGPVAIVDRDAADGRIRWQDKLQQQFSNAGQSMEQLVQAGQLALVQSNATPGQPVTLSRTGWTTAASPGRPRCRRTWSIPRTSCPARVSWSSPTCPFPAAVRSQCEQVAASSKTCIIVLVYCCSFA